MSIAEFIGKTFTSITGMEPGSESVRFETGSESYEMYHSQDCCESVDLNDVCGDPKDLIGTPILSASEDTSTSGEDGAKPLYDGDDSYTWTFYTLRTVKGTVTLRWYGSSNGYYSESVEIEKV